MLNLKYKRDRQWLLFWLLLIAVISLVIMINNKQGDFYDNFAPFILLIYVFLYLPFFIIRTIINKSRYKYPRDIPDGYSKKFDPKKRSITVARYLVGRHGVLSDKEREKYESELDLLTKKYKNEIGTTKEKLLKRQEKHYHSSLDRAMKDTEKFLEKSKKKSKEFQYGTIAAKVKCPHCHETGHVRRKVEKHTEETREKGFVGSVFGKKMITDKGNITKFFCENCNTPWTA